MGMLVVFVLSAMLAGCATITRGTTDQIGFDSRPSGAEVRTSNGLACVTPCSLQFKKNEEFIATFTKPGYQSQQVEVKLQVTGGGAAAAVGNVVVGGIIGFGVDAVTGAGYDHTPNPVSVVLQPNGTRAPPPAIPKPKT